MVTVVAMYFYTILRGLMWVNFRLDWIKYGHFSIIQTLIRVLMGIIIPYDLVAYLGNFVQGRQLTLSLLKVIYTQHFHNKYLVVNCY